ncbi:hypothetical protein Vadar_013390 [Vaccinium darrowii]|uniref:Uncharacterized protein n=1 Tax=Vaccinium darrowii TaxID=229202 RepID=A0ACB7YW70_9ERIC|nr:hypothetical protein Vadar_013390 [Vaccinium darrowii]
MMSTTSDAVAAAVCYDSSAAISTEDEKSMPLMLLQLQLLGEANALLDQQLEETVVILILHQIHYVEVMKPHSLLNPSSPSVAILCVKSYKASSRISTTVSASVIGILIYCIASGIGCLQIYHLPQICRLQFLVKPNRCATDTNGVSEISTALEIGDNNQSMDQLTRTREQRRVWQQQRRQRLTAEECAQERERNRKSQQLRLQSLTPEDNAQRLERRRITQQRWRVRNRAEQTMSQSQTERWRNYARQRRAATSNEQRGHQLARRRSNYRQRQHRGASEPVVDFSNRSSNTVGNSRGFPNEAPPEMADLFCEQTTDGRHFRKNIRAYNHVFSFTSMGVDFDEELAGGSRGVYTFRAHGAIYHRIGSLLPYSDQRPRYLQLYIYDTDHEIENRMSETSGLRRHIVEKLKHILDAHNPFVHNFRRMAQSPDIQNYKLIIKEQPVDRRQYDLPTASQVAAIIIGGDEAALIQGRDIAIQTIGGNLSLYSRYRRLL